MIEIKNNKNKNKGKNNNKLNIKNNNIYFFINKYINN